MAAGDMPEVNWGMPIIPLKRSYELDPSWGMGPDFDCTLADGLFMPDLEQRFHFVEIVCPFDCSC